MANWTEAQKSFVQTVRDEQVALLCKLFGVAESITSTGKRLEALESATTVPRASWYGMRCGDSNFSPERITTLRAKLPEQSIVDQKLGADAAKLDIELFAMDGIVKAVTAKLGDNPDPPSNPERPPAGKRRAPSAAAPPARPAAPLPDFRPILAAGLSPIISESSAGPEVLSWGRQGRLTNVVAHESPEGLVVELAFAPPASAPAVAAKPAVQSAEQPSEKPLPHQAGKQLLCVRNSDGNIPVLRVPESRGRPRVDENPNGDATRVVLTYAPQ